MNRRRKNNRNKKQKVNLPKRKRRFDFSKPFVFLPDSKKSPKVEWKDITYFSADSNYTDVHTVTHIVNKITVTLGMVESYLPDKIFFRIHESFLVNINHIGFVLKNHQIIMDDGQTLSVSKPHWQPLLDLLPFIGGAKQEVSPK